MRYHLGVLPALLVSCVLSCGDGAPTEQHDKMTVDMGTPRDDAFMPGADATTMQADDGPQPDAAIQMDAGPEPDATIDLGSDMSPSPGGDHATPDCSGGTIVVDGPTGAAVFVDGFHTGQRTPATVELPAGTHRIGLGDETTYTYLLREIEVTDPAAQCEVSFTAANRLLPLEWHYIYVDVPTIAMDGCTIAASDEELDAIYDFYLFSLDLLVKGSYGTHKWTGVRVRASGTVTTNSAVNLDAVEALIPAIESGTYDLLAFPHKARDGDCETGGSFGVGGWDSGRKRGFVTARFRDGDTLAQLAEETAGADGVIYHEFLHSVESHFEDRGSNMPIKRNGWALHAAPNYGYNNSTGVWAHPDTGQRWLDDYVRGLVPAQNYSEEVEGGYRGIGPEQFARCSWRMRAAGEC